MNNFTIQKAIDGFLLTKEAEGRSPKTISWYRHFLLTFKDWLARTTSKTMLDEVKAEHIREFLKYLREPHVINEGHRFKKPKTDSLSPRTVLGAFATFSGFFNWSCAEGLISQNPTANMKRPKLPKRISPVFSQEEMQALLKACDEMENEATAARSRAILLVLLDTGIRLGELLDLRTDRLNITDSSALVSGKGAKDRQIYFGAQAKKVLWRYISLFRPTPMGITTQVFLNHDGMPMKPRMVAEFIHKIARKAGVTNAHPHRFRHTAAVQFLRNGGNVFALQKMLGHSTLDMVRYYVELSQEDVRKVHKTASPADNWGLG